MSRTLPGIGIGRAAVSGPAVWVRRSEVPTELPQAGSVEDELATARRALAAVAEDLRRRAAGQRGVARDILQAESLMADDPDLLDDVTALIGEGHGAARAVTDAFEAYREILTASGGFLAERVADLDDVRRRVLAEVAGVELTGVPVLDRPSVLVATDLSPAETAELNPAMVLAFVTVEGGPTSHTAILARSRGIPALVGCAEAGEVRDGDHVLVDATAGALIVDPDESQLARLGEAQTIRAEAAGGPGHTLDGHRVPLLANIGHAGDLPASIERGAEGVGLLRTEFLFLDREEAPFVHEQVAVYREVFAALGDRKIVVRVLDAGADKPLKFLHPTDEPNPALGLRGLRSLRLNLDVLDMQLAALSLASQGTDARVQVMAPMVSDIGEVRWFVARAREAGLRNVGVMVEVPSIALMADLLMAEVDFVSIGTNDLAQYALAADRMLGSVGSFLDPWQPAVLRLVQLVAEAGLRAGKPVGVCGEAAADPLLACALVGVGVQSLSMSSGALGEVRATLAETSMTGCRRIAEAILGTGTAAAARTAVAALDPALLAARG